MDYIKDGIHFEIVGFFPENFFSKDVNEPFIKEMLETILPKGVWRKGNPNIYEPDYFYNNIPFEFTIASDKHFIENLRFKSYETQNQEDDVFKYIETSIKKKVKKKYSTDNVHLCILCLLDMTSWILEDCSQGAFLLVINRKNDFFSLLKEKYISTGKFSNIFLLFPDMFGSWWVLDVVTAKKKSNST